MISGLNTSGLSLALRTAERAHKTMDKMATQIATGKKVASVKDDGAAYVRAAALNSQKVVEATRKDFEIPQFRGSLEFTNLANAQHTEFLENLRSILISAQTYPAGSSQRQNIQAEWNAIISADYMSAAPNPFKNDGWTGHTYWGTILAPNDPATANLTLLVAPSADVHYGWMSASSGGPTIALATMDLVNASAAQFSQAHQSIDWIRDQQLGIWNNGTAAHMNTVDRLEKYTEANIDRIDSSISSLTDADMGKVSREYELAETRQSLAYETVKNAIAAYSNKANGVMSNVLNTQRSVMA